MENTHLCAITKDDEGLYFQTLLCKYLVKNIEGVISQVETGTCWKRIIWTANLFPLPLPSQAPGTRPATSLIKTGSNLLFCAL